MGQIRMTPEELRAGSSNIKSIAESVRENLTALKSKVDEVCNNWEGAAQSSFVTSFEELYANFQNQFPPTIDGIAEQMNSAAQAIEQTDTELSNAFRG